MAEEQKKTLILELEVDQGAAERQLERIEGVLLDNKKAVQDLQAAYKKGNITQAEYVKENIRLQQNIKKEQDLKKTLIKTIETESNSRNSLKARISSLVKEYDNLNLATDKGIKRADALEKELAQLNAQLTKGDKSAGLFKNQIGNYPKAFENAASSIKVAGVSIADMGAKLGSFINPATAAVGIAGALGAAYAQSAEGAKDLAFANDKVAASISIVSNELGKLLGGGEGKGLVSVTTEGLLNALGLGGLNDQADLVARAREGLRELELILIDAQGIRKQFEKAAEESRIIRDDDAKSVEERLKAADEVQRQLNANLVVRQSVQDRIITQLKIVAAFTGNDLTVQAAIKKAVAERRDIEEEITGKLTENVTARRNILTAQQEQLKLTQQLFEFDVREANAPPIELGTFGTGQGESTSFSQGIDDNLVAQTDQANKDFIKNAEVKVRVVQKTEAEIRGEYFNTLDARKAADMAHLQSAEIVFGALSELAQEGSAEQKALTLISIALDTAQAIAGATAASQDIPYPGNLVAMATSIATVLANIASAKNIIEGFEEGGYTGPGRDNQIAGAVHANEYVAPAYVVRSPEAQPHLHALERMRGYQDGGFVVNQSTAPINQSLIIANTLKNLPPVVASWSEGMKFGRRIDFKENVSRLGK